MQTPCRDTLLIVDDSELNRAILREIFYREYRIEEAENGRQALEAVARQKDRLAALLLDLVMPELDGFGVLEELARQGLLESIPVFLITAETSADIALQGYESGVMDVISKPITDPSIVRKRVDNAVELFRGRNQLAQLVEEQVQTIKAQSEKLRTTNASIIDMLSSVIEFRSGESGQHVRRIRQATRMLLQLLAAESPGYRLTAEEIEMVSSAAAMHDIGKILIPDYILNKPGRLTADEFEEMKNHTVYGCEILERIPFFQEQAFFRYCYDICRYHHERWDGLGYPDGLAGGDIPLWAQVVSLVDVYDALVSERVYKKPYPHPVAVSMIRSGECGAFNPLLLGLFLRCADELHQALYLQDGSDATPSTPPIDLRRPDGYHPPEAQQLSDRTLALLERERQKYHWLSEMSGEILFDYDRQSDSVEFTEKYQEVFSDSLRTLHARDHLRRAGQISPADLRRIEGELAALTPENALYRTEVQLTVRGGRRVWFELYMRSLWEGESGQVCTGYMGKLSSIDELKRESARWRQQAMHDYLTGLYNRQALEARVAEAICSPAGQPFSLLFVDLDNFKAVNDTKGHLAGDRLLQEIADKLPQKLRATDMVARIGGDEFAVFLEGMNGEDLLAKKAGEVCRFFCEELGEREPGISASVSCVRYPADGQSYKSLLQRADRALYTAKSRGKNQFALYTGEMSGEPYRPSLLPRED